MKPEEVIRYRRKVEAGDITSNDLYYMVIAGIQVNQKVIGEELFPNDGGGVYQEEIRKVTVRFPDGYTREFIDTVYNAPWQVGGNGGNVRDLIPLS